MPDRRDELRSELSALVKEGRLMLLSEQLATASPEARANVEEMLTKAPESQKPSRASTAGKKRSATTAKAATGGASKAKPSLKDIEQKIEGKRLSDHYQPWYSRALRVVEQLLPDRYEEFRALYQLPSRKEIEPTTYTVRDYLQGVTVTRGSPPYEEAVFDRVVAGLGRFHDQVEILASAEARLDSLLRDIKGVLEADLFDDELSSARELLTAKHLRSAGVVAGVVLERHLHRVIRNRQITFRKKPLLGNLNQALKDAGAYDVPQWRQIQRLTDLRNLCAHADQREPTSEEVDELIREAEKVVATVF
jgi:hypothetical protein